MKRLLAFLTALILLFGTIIIVNAAEANVVDSAGLLTLNQQLDLSKKIDKLVSAYSMDVVIVTVESLDGSSAQSYADNYYDYNNYGIGSNHSGILLLLAMEEREWAVSTCGDTIRTVTNSEIDDIMDHILSGLSDGNYYEAFDSFLNHVEAEYKAGINGTVVKIGDVFIRLLIALAIGAAIAGIALAVMRSKMNTAKPQSGARSYMVADSYDLFRHQDFYLYSHTSKVRKAENNSSGSHHSSSGRSHGGRSGRF